jgi:hypothetical protein
LILLIFPIVLMDDGQSLRVCHPAGLLRTSQSQMTEMPLLPTMASVVFSRHEAIRRADNKQITKHVTGNPKGETIRQNSIAKSCRAQYINNAVKAKKPLNPVLFSSTVCRAFFLYVIGMYLCCRKRSIVINVGII